MRDTRGVVVGMTLVLPLLALLASRAVAETDVGVPIHPKAITSSVVHQSGKGEGTEWVQVNFTTHAPYEQVIRFYKEKTGRNVQISHLESGKLLNTLILYAKKPQDQININISSQVGKKATQVEISRNRVPE
ncbi:MAG TPA: hypothetical protein VFF86_04030 [Candidatus Methylomirabilis sp.]|nr:hypothetical protein [Candidatus Methylomirabilis sp.]